MSPVLILTAGYGEGHNAAARGLQAGFAAIGVEAKVLDLFAPAFGATYERSRQDYIRIVNKRPWLWALCYQILDRVPFLPLLLPLLKPLKRELVAALTKWQPDTVVSVYPVYGYLLNAAVRKAGLQMPRRLTVVTDSITVNSVWYRCGADAFLVPNEDTADVMLAAGVRREELRVSGFPVSPNFAAPGPERPEPGSGVRPRVLFMVNGQPGRVVPLVERLLREGQVDLTVTAGKDVELKASLEDLAQRLGRPLEVLGWVGDVPGLLRRNHLLIGKAGGAMVQEALAAHTPMIVTQILPGQEEGNARLLIQNGCGVHCPTNEAVVEILGQVFGGDCVGWRRMYGHTVKLSRPDAARETALWIQAQRSGGKFEADGTFGVRTV